MYEEYEVGDFISLNENKMDKFEFLTSSRFWAMVIGSVAIYLKMKGFIGDAEMQLLATITAGFTIIRTADRFSDKSLEGAKIGAGQSTEQAKEV